MTTAWYPPSSFSPIPVGRSSDAPREEIEDEEEGDDEGEEEVLESVEYLCTLIDAELSLGVKLERIIIGGFSQGCAISLVTALASRYGGKVAGVVGLSGYLPKGKLIRERMKTYEAGLTKVFLAHGSKDMLLPMRVFRDAKARVGKVVGEEGVESHIYEGMGHVTCGAEFRDMCAFLEGIVPE
jgi:predicted esterase